MDNQIKERIHYLLDRCMQDQITTLERQELDRYILDGHYSFLIEDSFLQAFYIEKPLVDMPKPKQEHMLEAICTLPTTVEQIPIRYINYKWLAAAAVAILFFVFFFVYEERVENERQSQLTVESELPVLDTPNEDSILLADRDYSPAKEQAILILADGEQLQLDQIKIGDRIDRQDFSLIKLDAGKLEFHFNKNLGVDRKSHRNNINTLVTPRGAIYSVVLEDGSTVHLNASTRLIFPSYFTGQRRLVQLEGEAFFEVAKDADRQFVVQSGNGKNQQEILVYGTSFNISAYPGDRVFTTTLVEGSIKLRHVLTEAEMFLKPLQQANLQEDGFRLEPANLDVNLAWINKLFYFADHDLDQVMQQISRWYDVDIRYQIKKPSMRIWGQISRDKELSEVLGVLQQTNDVSFQIKGREVLVME